MLGLAAIPGAILQADVTLAPLFTDHAVLQRRVAVPIWGMSDPGEHITVTFRNHETSATADAAGRWRVQLPAMEAGAANELVIVGKNTLRLRDVVVGEVWLCGGQSNMAFRVEELEQPDVIAAAEHPLIRHFGVGFATAVQPLATAKGAWIVASPQTAGKFTATGYFFALELQARLGVPVGLVNSSVGGTQIESWMSSAALASNPAFNIVNERWEKVMAGYPQARVEYEAALSWWEHASGSERLESAKKNRRKPAPPVSALHRDAPASLFNAMIHPLVPYAMRGVIFDQGAANTPRWSEYGALFRALITDWRARWHQPELPFYFVQAPNYRDPNSPGANRAHLREEQASALVLPGTRMAVTIDIGTPDDPHPKNKAEVGRRLALIARAEIHGEQVAYMAPRVRRAEKVGDAVRVEFDTFGQRLVSRGGVSPQGFELAGKDRHFLPATARIEGEDVWLANPAVSEPVAVRYAWGDDPACELSTDAGLAAAPFRTVIFESPKK